MIRRVTKLVWAGSIVILGPGCGSSDSAPKTQELADARPMDSTSERQLESGAIAPDAEAGDLDAEPAWGACLQEVFAVEPCLHDWTYEDDTGSTVLRLVLLPAESPTKGTDGFVLVGAAGKHSTFGAFCVTDRLKLAYNVTHHNGEDSATVRFGEYAALYTEKLEANFVDRSYAVRVSEGSHLVVELELENVGCALPQGAAADCSRCRSKCCVH